jgi:uroporphyrinogen-III decarboxylase
VVYLFGPLIGLKEEWREQGASEDELDLSTFKYRAPMRGGIPVNTGWMGGSKQEVLEENEDYLIIRDRMGRTMKLVKGYATLPLPLDHPVKNMDDWLKIKHHYEFSEERFGADWEAAAKEHLMAGRATMVYLPGGFDEPRQLMGEEGVCVAFYEQPELIHDILNTIGDTACKVLDRVSSAVQVDELSVHEDMAGKSGPLAGPVQVTEFIKPYYRKVWDMLKDRGARLFDQDSDGNMNAVIPAFIDAGINVMHPMEPAAGMDMVQARETYGSTLAFMGGIDKHVIRRSKEEIVAELEYKIPPMVKTGGCLLSLDHRIPNGTPIENYRFYMKKAWEILERESAC